MNARWLTQFLNLESAGGIILFLAAAISLVWANSPLSALYQQLAQKSLFFVNEGLMTVFFLLIGLELKRNITEGQSQFSQIILPAIAAFGGMIVPAMIYWILNKHDPISLNGWPAPIATDVAFAITLLSLFSKRLPISLKLFLLALAIFDDIGAIILIAVLYSKNIAILTLCQAGILMLVLASFKYLGIRALSPYLLIGGGVWVCLHQSGIHPTLTGILLAMMIPIEANPSTSCLHRLEKLLHPWVSYCIMPLFALVNAGFPLLDLTWHHFFSTVTFGIMLGLFLGKQLGIFSFSWLLIQLRLAKLPDQSSWLALYGVSILCGIGFTMSLFLGTLSFADYFSTYIIEVRLGVLLGSSLSGLLAIVILYLASTPGKSRNA